MVNETHATSEMTDRHGNKLVQIQVIHRHGARAPSTALNFPSICGVSAYKAFYNFIPNLASDVRLSPSTPKYFNPNEASSCYNGQLSPVGAAQMFALGARLRARYSSILPDEFDESVLVVRSTAMRRTVESAVACLSGMYPNQRMRPLDIEIRTRREETMVGNKRMCDKLYLLSKATYASFHIPASTESRATELLPPLASDASAENRLYSRSHFALALRDIAIALRENGCQAQPWESHELPLAVSQIHKIHSRQTWRLGLGRFVDELLHESESYATNPWRCKIYSGHDTTLLPVMACFEDGAYRGLPDFADDVVLETWEPASKDDEAQLRLKYNGNDVIIKGCEEYGTLCPLSVVRKAISKHIPQDFAKECEASTTHENSAQANGTAGTTFLE